jgi:hypothetical protein
MKNNKGQNTMTEKLDTTIYALVEQNDGSLKRVPIKEYKQQLALENLKKMIKTDLKKWSKTKDGKNYKLFYQLEQLR